MRELLQFLPVLVFLVVIVSVVRAAAKVASKVKEQAPAPRSAADYDPDLANRTRRIQEEIRRKIAERRGLPVAREPAPEAVPVGPGMEPPVIFAAAREEPSATAAAHAVLERQQQLADQMRALEQARATEQRRAANVTAAIKIESESERGLLTGTRGDLLADLRDPASLRRVFVLREVLGTPVGLR